MRTLGTLLLLLFAFGAGLMPEEAVAAPCPFHADEASYSGHVQGAGTSEPGHLAEIASEPAGMPALPMGRPVHSGAEGHFCCHVATAFAAPLAPPLGPVMPAARPNLPRSWLLPPTSPAADIFHPPITA